MSPRKPGGSAEGRGGAEGRTEGRGRARADGRGPVEGRGLGAGWRGGARGGDDWRSGAGLRGKARLGPAEADIFLQKQEKVLHDGAPFLFFLCSIQLFKKK